MRSLLGEEAVLASAGSFSFMPAAAAARNGHVALSVGDRQEQPHQLPLQAPGFALQAVRVIGISSLGCGVGCCTHEGTARDSSPSFAFAPFPLGTSLGTPYGGSAPPRPQGCWLSLGPHADAPEGLVSSLGFNTVRGISVLVAEAPPSRECQGGTSCLLPVLLPQELKHDV